MLYNVHTFVVGTEVLFWLFTVEKENQYEERMDRKESSAVVSCDARTLFSSFFSRGHQKMKVIPNDYGSTMDFTLNSKLK